MPTHTPTPLKVWGRVADTGKLRGLWSIDDANETPVALVLDTPGEDPMAFADELVLRYNTHDALVSALRHCREHCGTDAEDLRIMDAALALAEVK